MNGNLPMQIFFVLFVTAPLWATLLAGWLDSFGPSPWTDRLATLFGFLSSQAVLWDFIFLIAVMMGAMTGEAQSSFLVAWNWLMGGDGMILWYVSLAGYLLSLFVDNDSLGARIACAWFCSVLALLMMFFINLIAAGVRAIGSVLG